LWPALSYQNLSYFIVDSYLAQRASFCGGAGEGSNNSFGGVDGLSTEKSS
jgi:hypothetical protein